jgi:hypothetical protein
MLPPINGRISGLGLLPRPKGGKGPAPVPFIPFGAEGRTEGGPEGPGT